MGLFNIILIFTSTMLFCLIVIRSGAKYLQEKQEFAKNPRLDQLRFFVSPEKLLMQRIYGALISGCVLFIVQLLFGVEKMAIALPVALGGGIAAYELIYWFYWRQSQKRKAILQAKVLDFAIGLANGMRSGLALGQAIESVAQHMTGPMKDELTSLLREYRLGVDLPEAFRRMYLRMPSEDLHLLVTTIALTTQSGGSLSEVLDEIVKTIRSRNEFQAKLENMTAQGKFEAIAVSAAPLAAFLVLYFIDPVLMTPLVTTGTGWIAIGVVAIMISIGYYVLKKITTIEV